MNGKNKKGGIKKRNTTNLTWFTNVGRSLGFATTDLITEILPATSDLFGQTKDLTNDAREFIRENKNNHKRINDVLSQGMGKPLKDMQDIIKTAKDDLRSGKFNNKAKGLSDFDDFGFGDDFDLGFGDDDFSFSFGDETDSSFDLSDDSSDDSSDSSPSVVVPSVNISSNITKNNPMVKALQSQTEMISVATTAQMEQDANIAINNMMLVQKTTSELMTGISTVNENLTLLLKFQEDSMSKYISSSLKYYEDNLKVLNDTLEFLKKPEEEKKENSAYSSSERIKATDLLWNDGGLDLRQYFNFVKQQGKDAIANDFMISSIQMMLSNEDAKKSMMKSPLASIPKAIVKTIIPGMLRETMSNFDGLLSTFLPAMLMKIGDLRNSFIPGVGLIGEIFGLHESTGSSRVDVGKYEKGKIPFDGVTKKAITEVIPGYLRQILSALTGEEEKAFDYDSGKFKTVSKMKKDFDENQRNSMLREFDGLYDIKGRLDAFEFANSKEKDEFSKKIDDAFVAIAKHDGFVNPHKITKKDGEVRDDLKDVYNFGSDAENELFRQLILSLPKHEIAKMFSKNVLSARASQRDFIKKEEENVSSASATLFNGLVGFEKDGSVKKVSKNGSSIFSPKDSFGKTSSDYLRDIKKILLEGIKVFVSKGNNSQFLNNRLTDFNSETTPISSKVTNENIQRTFSDYEKKYYQESGRTIVSSISDLGTDGDSIQSLIQKRLDKEKEEDKKEGMISSFMKKMFTSKDGEEKSFKVFVDKMIKLPSTIMNSAFEKADAFLYKTIFGLSDNGEGSLFQTALTKIGDQFKSFFGWLEKSVYEPLKESLLGENGLITKIRDSEWWNNLKEKGRNFRDYLFGKSDENGTREGGLFSGIANEMGDILKGISYTFTGKAYSDSKGKMYGENKNSIFGHIGNTFKSLSKTMKEYFFGNEKEGKKSESIFGTLASSIKDGFQNFSDAIFGPKSIKGKKNKNHIAIDELTKSFKEKAPKAFATGIFGAGAGLLLGGKLGLLGSLFLPGGPIGGAVLGTALGFLTQSEKFKSYLFGEKDDNGERIGGLISKKAQEFFKKNKTALIGGTALGLVKGITGIGFLPSFLVGGPVTGAMFGLGTALITKSEWFKNMMFGKESENGERVGGIFSKITSKLNGDKDFKKKVGTIGAGLIGGAGIGAILSNFGIMGGLMFGPIGGAAVGVASAIALTSNKWKTMLFGEYDEETQIRKGGLLNTIMNKVHYDVLEPLKIQAIEWGNNVRFWFEEKIGDRFLDALYPIKEEFKRIKDRVVDSFVRIGEWFNQSSVKKNMFDPIVEGFSKLFDPLKKSIKYLTESTAKMAGKVLSAPFKVLEFIGNNLVKKHMKEGLRAVKEQIIENIKNSPIGQFVTNAIVEPVKNTLNFIKKGTKQLFSMVMKGTFTFLGFLGKGMLKITGKVMAAPFQLLAAPFKAIGKITEVVKSLKGKDTGAVKKQDRLDAIKSGNRGFLQSIGDLIALSNPFSALRHDAKVGEDGANYQSERLAARNERLEKRRLEKEKKAQEIQAMKDSLSNDKALISRLNLMGGTEGDAVNFKDLDKLLAGEYGKGWNKLSKKEQDVFKKSKLDSMTAEATRKNTENISDNTKKTVSAIETLTSTMKSLFSKGWESLKEKVSEIELPSLGGLSPQPAFAGMGMAGVNMSSFSLQRPSAGRFVDKIPKLFTKKENVNSIPSVGGIDDREPIVADNSPRDDEQPPSDDDPEPEKKKSEKLTITPSSIGKEFSKALEMEDNRDDQEEENKEKEKEKQEKLEEKLQFASRKTATFQMEQMKIKNEEEEKRTFMTTVVDLLGKGNADRSESNKSWMDIFGKKGLITSLLLLGLPFISEILKKGLNLLGNIPGGLIGALKEGINWMNNNEQRILSDGSNISNADFNESVIVGGTKIGAGLAKTAIKYGDKIVKGAKAGYKTISGVGKGVAETTKKFFGKTTKEVGEEVGEKVAKTSMQKAVKKGKDILGEGFTKGKKFVSEAIESGSSKLKGAASKAASSIDNATKGLLSNFIKFVNETAVPKISGLFSKIAKGKSDKVTSAIRKMIDAVLTPKNLAKHSGKIASGTARTAGSVATLGILDAIFVTWGVVTGSMEAGRLFGVSPDRVDWLMRAISAAIKGIMNLGFMFVVDILNDITTEVMGLDFLRVIATTVYNVLSSDARSEDLMDAQNEYKAEWEAFNEAEKAKDPNFQGISFDAYIDMQQKTVGQKIGEGFSKVGKSVSGFLFGKKDEKTGEKVSHGLIGGAVNAVGGAIKGVANGVKSLFGFGSSKTPGMGGATAEEALLGDLSTQGIQLNYATKLNPMLQREVERVVKTYDNITKSRLSDLVHIVTMPEMSGTDEIFNDEVKAYLKETLHSGVVSQVVAIWSTASELSSKQVSMALGIDHDKYLGLSTGLGVVGGVIGTFFGGPIGTAVGAGIGSLLGTGIGKLFDKFKVKKDGKMIEESVNKLIDVNREIYQKSIDDSIVLAQNLEISEILTPELQSQLINSTKDSVAKGLTTVWAVSNELSTTEWEKSLGVSDKFSLYNTFKKIGKIFKTVDDSAKAAIDNLTTSTMDLYNKGLEHTVNLITESDITTIVTNKETTELFNMTKDNVSKSLSTVWTVSNELSTTEWEKSLGVSDKFNFSNLFKKIGRIFKTIDDSAKAAIENLTNSTMELYNRGLTYSVDWIMNLGVEEFITSKEKATILDMTKENVSNSLKTVWNVSNELSTTEWEKALGVSDKFNFSNLFKKIGRIFKTIDDSAKAAIENLTTSTMNLYNKGLDHTVNWLTQLNIGDIITKNSMDEIVDITKENVSNAIKTVWNVSNELSTTEWEKALGVSDKFNFSNIFNKISKIFKTVDETAKKSIEKLTTSTMDLYNRELTNATNWFMQINTNDLITTDDKGILFDLTKENLKNALGTAWSIAGQLAVEEWNKSLGLDAGFNFWNTVKNVVAPGAAIGGAIGAFGGPVGSAIGAAIGGAVSFLGNLISKETKIDQNVQNSISMLIDKTAELYNRELVNSVNWFNEIDNSSLLLDNSEREILFDMTKENLKNALGTAWGVAGQLAIEQWNKSLGLDAGFNFWERIKAYGSGAIEGAKEGSKGLFGIGAITGAIRGIIDTFKERNGVDDKIAEAISILIDKTEVVYNNGLLQSVQWLEEYDPHSAITEEDKSSLLGIMTSGVSNALGTSWGTVSEIISTKWEKTLEDYKKTQFGWATKADKFLKDMVTSNEETIENNPLMKRISELEKETNEVMMDTLDKSKSILTSDQMMIDEGLVQNLTSIAKGSLTTNLTNAWYFNVDTLTAKWENVMSSLSNKYNIGSSVMDGLGIEKSYSRVDDTDEIAQTTSLEMEALLVATNKLWAHRLSVMASIVNNGSLQNIELVDGSNLTYSPINDGVREVGSFYNSLKEPGTETAFTEYLSNSLSDGSKFHGLKQMMFYSRRLFGLAPYLFGKVSKDTSNLYNQFSKDMALGLSNGESILKSTKDVVNSIKSTTNLSEIFSNKNEPKNPFASLSYHMGRAFLSPLMIMKKMIMHVVDIYKKQDFFDLPNFNVTTVSAGGKGGATKEQVEEDFELPEETSPIKGAGMGGAEESEMINKYPVTSNYGMRGPIKGTTHTKTNMHYGIDLSLKGGNIPSFTDGVVKTVANNKGGYGKYVIVQDSAKYHHLYAHMSKTSVKQGQTVQRGEPLGVEGSTGNSSGPHLHYEVRTSENQYGKTVNPKDYLKNYKGVGTTYKGSTSGSSSDTSSSDSTIQPVTVDNGTNSSNATGLTLLTSTLGDALNGFISPLNEVTSALTSAMSMYTGASSSSLESTNSSPDTGSGHEAMSSIVPTSTEDRIGYYIKEFESGNKGPAMISSGKGDYGGVSFGTYQFPSYGKRYTDSSHNLVKFWNFSGYANKYPGVKPGDNPEFKSAWAKEANANPQEFADKEYAFAINNYYTSGRNSVKKLFDPDKHSRAAQEITWSTSVQYGPGSNGKVHTSALKGVSNPQSLTPEALINKIADYKYSTVDSWFKNSGKSMKDGIRLRHGTKERNKLLGIKDKAPVKYPGMGGATLEQVSIDDKTLGMIDGVVQETFPDNVDFLKSNASSNTFDIGMGGADKPETQSTTPSRTLFHTQSTNLNSPKSSNTDIIDRIISELVKIANNTSTTNTHLTELAQTTRKISEKPVNTDNKNTPVIQNNNIVNANTTNNNSQPQRSNSPMMDMINKEKNRKSQNNRTIAQQIARGF